MSKYFFIWGLALGVLAGSLFQIFGQDEKQLARLYAEQRIVEIEKLLEQKQITDPEWQRFFETLFVENADSVIQILISVYHNTNSRYLKPLIRQKISQYYYARGYYETAERIVRDDIFFQKIISMQEAERGYGIQIGAYSSYGNAQQARKKYLRYFTNLTIMTKNINGRKLYVLIMGKYSTKSEAEKELKVYRKKYGIKGYIIQF